MRIILVATLLWFFPSLAHEFLYPVGMSVKQERVYVVYQKTATHIELWEWDCLTGYANQLLLSRYSPAGFTLLPDESGFSFIDNGLLKTKRFIKRSPRTIAFDAPICQVELVHWIDSANCYAAARYNDYSGIFQIDRDGIVHPVLYQEGKDVLYPQKLGEMLYYIERTEDAQYRFVRTLYQIATDEDWHKRITVCQNHDKGTTLIDFKSQPIAFLQMVSHEEGVGIGYPLMISRKHKAIPFKLYRFFMQENSWNSEELFSFSIPTSLLLSGTNQRIYESILPLLPQVFQHCIYFVDSSATGFLTVYRFDKTTKKITQCTKRTGQHYFGVCPFEGGILYGGEMGGGIDLQDGARLILGQV